MKKTIIIVSSLVVLGFTFYYFKNDYGWMEFRTNTDTPEQFLNRTANKKTGYAKDSLRVSQELKTLLLQHQDFFYSKEYFEGTDILIDTIVYSPNFNKLAVLFITKNPTSRQLMASDADFYYNATAYLGIRQNHTISLSWLGPNFTNSTNKSELSKELREACFRTFVTKDTGRVYNFNDRRFWSSSVWEQREADKIKRKEFEEEKLKHPENVYEPPK